MFVNVLPLIWKPQKPETSRGSLPCGRILRQTPLTWVLHPMHEIRKYPETSAGTCKADHRYCTFRMVDWKHHAASPRSQCEKSSTTGLIRGRFHGVYTQHTSFEYWLRVVCVFGFRADPPDDVHRHCLIAYCHSAWCMKCIGNRSEPGGMRWD